MEVCISIMIYRRKRNLQVVYKWVKTQWCGPQLGIMGRPNWVLFIMGEIFVFISELYSGILKTNC